METNTNELIPISEHNGKEYKLKITVAWAKVTGLKFNAVTYNDVKGEKRPMYELSKTEKAA